MTKRFCGICFKFWLRFDRKKFQFIVVNERRKSAFKSSEGAKENFSFLKLYKDLSARLIGMI